MAEEMTGAVEGAGGLRLFYRSREVPGSRARLLAVHGLGDHSGRFERLAEATCDAGLDFYALDLRGHGRSGGRRGHASSFDRLLQDLDRFRRRARTRETRGPTFLLGHSLGGLVVGRYVQEFAFPALGGAILAAPFVELSMSAPAWKLRLAEVADRILPALALGSGIRVEDQFREAAERDRWNDDPLVHDRLSARLWGEMRRNSALFRARADQVQTPFLVLLAGDDRIVATDAARRAAAELGGRADVREYPGAFHSLFQDPCTGTAVRDLLEWIDAGLNRHPGEAGTRLV